MKRTVALLLALFLLWALPALAEPAPTPDAAEDLLPAGLADLYADMQGEAEAAGEAFHAVFVCGPEGEPVPGAFVNFCTDTFCMPVQSDENGVAAFTGEALDYHLQILKVPEGYGFDPALELYTGEASGWTVLQITRAEP